MPEITAMKLYIRNMACESCKFVVKTELENLGLHPKHIDLGEADVKEKLTADQKKKFDTAIRKVGLQLTEHKEGLLLEKIKKVILEYVNNSGEKSNINFSDLLSKELNYSYSYLASYFSDMHASTIEQYIISLKIEKVKEMILFDDLTLTEIAHRMNYSSVAHLSTQFKKVTGLTPTHFKKLRAKRRIVLQDL